MNYLGHAFLSFGDGDILTGNMIGDHVKGKIALEQYPDGIKKGIMLHRKIDEYTDLHPATQRAKLPFREVYGLYAGAIMDTCTITSWPATPSTFRHRKHCSGFRKMSTCNWRKMKNIFRLNSQNI